MNKRSGSLIWKDCNVEWWYETFKDPETFVIEPHFKIKVTNKAGEAIEWPHVTIDTNSVNDLKGITDFTKLPLEIRDSVLDNCIIKLNEDEPEITRTTPDGNSTT